MKSSLFYIKKILKSPLFIVALLFNLYLTKENIDVLETKLFSFVGYYYFAYICANLYMIISSASIMSKDYEVLSFLERDRCKKMIVTLYSSAMIAIIMFILPLGTVLIFNKTITDHQFVVNVLLHFFIIWTSSNILATTIGAAAGMILKNTLAPIVAIGVYGLFLYQSQIPTHRFLRKYINFFDDHTFVESNHLSGPIFNNSYIMDKLFIILLIVLIIMLLYSFYSNGKKIVYISLACMTLSLSMFLLYQGKQQQVVAEPIVQQDHSVAYTIQSYHMDLHLQRDLQNKADVSIHFTKNVDNIELLLEDIFTIKELKINKKQIEFHHQDGVVNIPASFQKNQTIQLSIEYEGTVDVENEFGVNTFYVHNQVVNLPGEYFAWYPKLKGHHEGAAIPFDVKIDTPAAIFSNIPANKHDHSVLSGKAENLNVFAGNYQVINNNNIQYIIPTTYDVDFFLSVIDEMSHHLPDYNDQLSEQEMEFIRKKSYNKVIVGVWPYGNGDLKLVDNTLLVRYYDY
ncbi:hypothetical protein [Bacillus sp. Hm123]|uniref:hypothetical protein n=1 Tax=Bacillus sp. Hm123 TaxID=3450745 RepID=UPI003F445235